MKNFVYVLLGLLFIQFPTYAQGTLEGIFSGTRMINGHSLETNKEGELEMIISHRFGRINSGGYELFGLDQATIRLGLEYALWDGMMVGVGRSSFEKTYDAFAKIRLFRQSRSNRGMPFGATYLGSVAMKTLRESDPVKDELPASNLFFTHQLLIGGRAGDRFSWQLMPTVVHRNFVETAEEAHDVFALGGAFRIGVSKNMSLVVEYYGPFAGQLTEDRLPSLAFGLDIDTGGHVFQIHVTNSRGMVEKVFITDTTGDWSRGDLHIGFNIGRIFKLKGRWY
ncbi:MAG: DUF5777 family beta-barrel protein [Bacteroidota bacterium]